MTHNKYSFKCKNCGLVVYSPELSGSYLDECIKCECKKLKRRYLADFFRQFIHRFILAIEWAIDKIEHIFLPAVIILGVCGGIMYSVYSFNKNECNRVHNLGYETDFGFYGGCYVKFNGHWIPFEIQGVNVITEGK